MGKMNKYYMGIDTSAYTTSVAVVNEFGEVVFDKRAVLKVKLGERGLRQQEAVFQHIVNLPEIFDSLCKKIDTTKIKTVSASVKPRNVEKSYMPVFRVAQGQAFIISKILNAEYKEFSHQDGHIAAGILGSRLKITKPFLAFHISGGTTELLYVEEDTKNYNIKLIGGTKDISAGQLIDRIGVKLGFNFPCGNEMDFVSKSGSIINKKLPINTDGTWINFSGAETFFYKLVEERYYTSNDISNSLFNCIANAIVNIVIQAIKMYDIHDILFIGGVASNSIIREVLEEKIVKAQIGNVYFPNPIYCSDNAIGIAFLGAVKEGERNFGGL